MSHSPTPPEPRELADSRPPGGTARTPGTRTPRRVQWAEGVDVNAASIRHRPLEVHTGSTHALDEAGLNVRALHFSGCYSDISSSLTRSKRLLTPSNATGPPPSHPSAPAQTSFHRPRRPPTLPSPPIPPHPLRPTILAFPARSSSTRTSAPVCRRTAATKPIPQPHSQRVRRRQNASCARTGTARLHRASRAAETSLQKRRRRVSTRTSSSPRHRRPPRARKAAC
ncbi:hypothetical protein FA95DRAFT_144789 [Auriscalpium vulgare]|uniref:Uncharacterized protein n=1 Tax=Auriscalpium vulgare TaxID=40419 RepID=A0ACB8S6Q1_9AGAM|nr:hypothetical protein FA95DRAFT_144789 [Auriscalpium vulgare]